MDERILRIISIRLLYYLLIISCITNANAVWIRGRHNGFHCSRPLYPMPIKRNNISEAMESRKTHKLHRIYAIELLL